MKNYSNRLQSSTNISDELSRLAAQVRRLGPSHRHPERFHENKSEIANRLRTLSRMVNGRAF